MNPVTELLIMDILTEMEMPVGEVGEVWLRGVSGAKEYWRLPEVSFLLHPFQSTKTDGSH